MEAPPKLYIDSSGKMYRNPVFKSTSLYIHFLNKSISTRRNLIRNL